MASTPALAGRVAPAVVLLGAIAFGWSHIGAPLYYDEAWTLVNFARQPVSRIVTDYSAPNNHIAHSLLLHVWSWVIGDPVLVRPDTAILRIPALVMYSLGVLAFFAAARRLIQDDPLSAAAATAVFACHPQVLPFASALRGYGPSVCLFAVLLALVAHQDRVSRLIFAEALAVLVFLIHYTVPSNVWFTLPFAVAALAFGRFRPGLEGGSSFRATLVAFAVAGVATVLAYLPVYEQMKPYAGPARPLGEALRDAPGRLVEHLQRLSEGVGLASSSAVTLLLAAAGIAALCWHARAGSQPAQRAALLALPVLLLAAPCATLFSPAGYVRNYMPGAPFFVLAYVWAIRGAAELAAKRGLPACGVAVGLCLMIALWNGFEFAVAHGRDMRPDEVVRLVEREAGLDTPVLVGEYADLSAHMYYAAAFKQDGRLMYFTAIEPGTLGRYREVWFVTNGDHDLNAVREYHKIDPARWQSSARRVRTIGRYVVDAYREEARTPGARPQVTGGTVLLRDPRSTFTPVKTR